MKAVGNRRTLAVLPVFDTDLGQPPSFERPLNFNLRRRNSISEGPASRQGVRPTRYAHIAVGTAVYNDHHTEYPTLQTL
jgi:hypothetical protein